MSRERIEKKLAQGGAPPVMEDYVSTCAAFTWDGARRELAGLPDSRGINIAHEAVGRHVVGRSATAESRARVALSWLGRDGARRDVTYAALHEAASRFASALDSLGVKRGDRVFTLLGRTIELYVAAIGALQQGAVLSPLFSAFGPDPIAKRLELGSARVLVTTDALYDRKLGGLAGRAPSLEHIIIVRTPEGASRARDHTRDWSELIERASSSREAAPTRADDFALLHFTSGTTGTPKGAIHVHEAIVQHRKTAELALDLRPGDVFWCTADPGWVTGTSYGILAPLAIGATLLVDEGELDAERWYATLERERVNVWYTAPTAVRMLMKAGDELLAGKAFPDLRFMASVGEPLNAEAVLWSDRLFGMPFHDNWWQTETGGIMIANFRAMDVKPGSMGKPMPGVEAEIVHRRPGGSIELVREAGVEGEIALRRGWPSMFRGYLGDDARYRACFAGEWYLTGDLARRDRDGYFWFVGRADDVIKSAGHLIGPFEVESALMEHPAVAEAGAIGKPDPVSMETVKAFVSLRPGHAATEALRLELLAFARKKLGAAVAPREIEFDQNLPHTRSGKVMRRLLRARELGLPEGDTSTVEGRE